MKWNMNNEGGGQGHSFVRGKRYVLVIVDAQDKFGKANATPYLHLKFQTEAQENAYDKKLYNTDKAAYRIIEWAKAMGFPAEGDQDLNPESMKGIRITAEYDLTKPNEDGKTFAEWVKPLPVKIGGQVPAPAASKMAPPAPEKEERVNDDIPF